ncbi:MAG: enoyl-CoA hydratase [Sulfuricaulis sp.]|nr:enoyl-CoA hydratase [Sulfuricaulis sp.]
MSQLQGSERAAPLVLIEKDPAGYAVVTLNRPRALNALSRALRDELATAFDHLAADPGVRVLILTGAGRAFCAGIDVKELSNVGLGRAGEVADPVLALSRFAGPVIAAVNGVAVTGGFELALACDILLASEEARFADTHGRIGILPGWGLSQRLSRRIGVHRAKELSLTGKYLSAAQAEHWGLVNQVLAAAELLSAARSMALEMLSLLPHMLLAYKQLIDDGAELAFGAAMQLEQQRSGAANQGLSPAAVAAQTAALFAHGHGAAR